MPRFITFNGQTLFKPGALSRVTASPNRRSNPTATGIVALIGEADSGPLGIQEFTDPLQIKPALGGGDLATAAALCFDPSNDPAIQGGAFKTIVYKTNSGTQAATNLPSTDVPTIATSTAAALSTNTVINWTAGALVVNAHVGRWLALATPAAQVRRITANAAGTITVSPPFNGDPTTFTGLAALILCNELAVTARDYGLTGNQTAVEFEAATTTNKYIFTASNGTTVEQSPEICGDEYLRLEFVGGPIVGTGVITAATTSTITYTTAANVLINAFATYVVDLPDGFRRSISSNTAQAVAPGPVTITLNTGYELTTAQAAACVGDTLTVRAVTAGTASITGANGVATGLTSTITQVPVSALDNLSLTFSTLGITTLQQLVDYINANTNYSATIPNGIAPGTLLAEFDFGAKNTNVVVRFDNGIATTNPSNKGAFRRDLQTLVDWINDFSSLVSATRSTAATDEGAALPAPTGGSPSITRDPGGFIWLVGGLRGTSTNTNWQTGFDALRDHRANEVVAVITADLSAQPYGSTATWNSVAAQLLVHVNQCNGQYKNERGGFIGYAGTRSGLISKSALFNSRDVQITGQSFTVLDINGNLAAQAPWSSAAIAAGMRAGGLGESLTRKYPRVTAATQDTSWNPANRDDVNALLAGGVLFAEVLPNGVVRWVRDITTYTIDDLETSIDGQTRDVVRYIAYDLRTFIEDTFTGQRVRNGRDGRPPTIASIREMAGARLGTYVDLDLLINSLDPQDSTKTVPGFDRLRVTIDGSVLKLTCRIFPTVAIAFEELDITTEIPLLSAGA